MTLGSSFALRLNVGGSVSQYGIRSGRSIKLGFLAPLTGPVASWGKPGLNGCMIWADWINQAGGVLLNGERYSIEIIPYDCGYDPEQAINGARQLVLEDNVKFLLMLGGDTFLPIQEFIRDRKILTSTLLPSDLSPDTPYLIAPSEIHPIYNVTAVDWISKNKPEIKTVAMCSQSDALGLPSAATYRAAFEAANIKISKEILYDPDTPNISQIVSDLTDTNPDMLCWCTSYGPIVHKLSEEAYRQNFKGQILSCTADYYKALIEKTSSEFMEGFIFQFPDFDDPKLNSKAIHFTRPNAFYNEYIARYPGTWSAVSWEYVSILDQWLAAIDKAGTVEPVSVLAALKDGGRGRHAFGDAVWWGEELFGINNALVGDWPVVMIQDGKARIIEFRSTIEWCRKNVSLLKKHMRDLGQMWDQRMVPQQIETLIPPRKFTPMDWDGEPRYR